MYECTQKIIKNKVGLLNLAEELGNVSRACKVMGFSRDTFYRYKSAVEEGGVESLFDNSRRQPNIKNRTDEATEKAVLDYVIECPPHGQTRVSNELRKRGIFVSPSGVRCIWLRHDLASFKQRLNALEKKSAEENFIFTEAQLAALERKQDDDLACGEIETAHPGYLGSQDTFYVGTLKGVGRVYPQTNGICERFHKTILNEFYQITFRKKIYTTIDELQKDLDDWLHYYNHERTHQGKMCCGRTPIETLIDGKRIWKEKVENLNLN